MRVQPDLDEHVSGKNVVLALVFPSGQLIPPQVQLLEGKDLAGVEAGFAALQQRHVADARLRENCFA